MAEQYVVGVLLDRTLNISAAGPFRSQAKAQEACDRINQAGDWTSGDPDGATIIAQVVTLRSVSELVADSLTHDLER